MEEMIDSSADSQEMLERLIEEGRKKIYLVEGTYRIPGNAQGIDFIGIGDVKAAIEEKDERKFLEQRLQFKDLFPADEESKKMMALDDTKMIFLDFLKLMELQLERI